MEPSQPVPCVSGHRFHKLIWGSFGNGLLEGSGVIAGGGDNGMLTLYNVTHILSSGKEPVIAQRQKHMGAVRALDFNPFQGNLLASGASNSEIFIWDLNNLSVPMTPGSKSQQPPEDIKALSWNRQVQYILSSAHPSGKAVVWDLRKNEPIIKVSDHSNRMHCSGLAWHPAIATQLVLCSEDDRLPVIQLWDLRFASSPLKVLESHSRGILSVSWSQGDAELLLSSAKDNQVLCWDLGSSEVVYKLPTQSSWCFDVQWCPRDPPVFSAASFDGWISLYSVMGRSWEVQHMRQAYKISSSFSKGQPLPPLQVPEQVAQASLIPPLKKPPKWIRRPSGVSFAFGGKLVTFGLPSSPAHHVPQPCPRLVFVSQVTTESELLMRSTELQKALGSENLLNYCQNKSQQASLQSEKMLWQFLKVTLEQDSRMKFLKLLGYSKDELQKKLLAWVVQKNWKDMVCTCSLENWREVLALLLTYSGPEKFPELCDILGNRMEQEGSRVLTSEARLCYVCSGSVERLVECWAKCHQASSPMALQDLMEKVMVLNRSLKLLQGPNGVSPGPATTYRITQYVNLLASQGSLAAAMSFLPSDCAQPPVQQLRDRLFHAQDSAVLGQQPPPFPFPRIAVGATPHSKETSAHGLGSQSSHQVPTPRPRVFTPQSSLVMPLKPSHPNPYQGSRMQNISDYRVPGPQAAQPLPLGPGVRPALSQPQLLGGQRAQAPNPVGFLGTWPLPGPSPPMASLDIVQPGSTSLPETSRLLPLLPVRLLDPSPMSSQPPVPPASFPAAYTPGGAPCSSTIPATGILTSHPAPEDSWKDAPAPRRNLQRKKLPETFMPPAPITAPVMSLSPEPRRILPSQPPVSSMSHAPPGAPGELSLQQLQQLPPQKMERKELPPEHQSLKTSFEALLQRCCLSATDLKTKRKLDEAAQRLEYLYEKICEGTLSPHVLAGLHEVARCVDTGSFEQGLAVHAQVASCSSFSEVSSFMPILKAVLTIAHKLQI
ncbi:PREDICTED: protein transport protein Sec31B isoform X2 [Propithecus coquereli]|uniref:protein transport protein Sec31B isoform X2 n=1 Tax=Propithecus coquereli TaxID=379532 RepID=UPI00063F3EEA|nr:PREDICTED: protein transport protein Sec31B isoform X2 [Propithecus coquereli]